MATKSRSAHLSRVAGSMTNEQEIAISGLQHRWQQAWERRGQANMTLAIDWTDCSEWEAYQLLAGMRLTIAGKY